MRKIYLLLYAFCPFLSFAQVGIGTANPQKDLHIAGSTSTIRIEKLSSLNCPTLNNGVKPAQVFVDSNGELTLTPPGFGAGLNVPLNFLIDVPNFIPDNPNALASPYNRLGTIITSPVGSTSTEALIHSVVFTVPATCIVEVKHGVTMVLSDIDMSIPPHLSYISDAKSRVLNTFFCFDIGNNGLSPAEKSLQYGHKGTYYCSNAGGSLGYPYMNSQGYATLPAGTHSIHFFGVVTDPPNTVTSVGFGGATDYLKLRVYN